MTDRKNQRERIFQVSSNRERASHKLHYVEASAPANEDCRLCVGSLSATASNADKFSIATTTYDEIAKIALFEKQLYGKQAYPALFFYQALRQWPDTFLTLRIDKTTAGYSLMVPISGSVLSLMSLLVGKAFQRKGVGKELLQQSIMSAHSLNYKQLELSVSPTNRAAVALYESVGFSRTDKIIDYLGPGEDRLLMTLSLAQT